MTHKCDGYNPFNRTQTVVKDNKTYQVQNVSAETANKIAQDNFDRRIEELNKRTIEKGPKKEDKNS